jgi:phenylacetic acid degradation operon negative regulatory protein
VLRSRDLELLPDGKARLEATWRIDELAAAYQAYLEQYRELALRASAETVPPVEALIERTQLVDDWRALVRDDPDLPLEFLPRSFPRATARELFLRTYRALAEPATVRFEQLVQVPDAS